MQISPEWASQASRTMCRFALYRACGHMEGPDPGRRGGPLSLGLRAQETAVTRLPWPSYSGLSGHGLDAAHLYVTFVLPPCQLSSIGQVR